MEKRTQAVLILVALALIGGLAFSRLVEPRLRDLQLGTASDVGRIKGTISVAGDNYLGYWVLTSREFTHQLRQRGYLINWTNDQANYAERHRKFAEGKYDVIVLPINSYLFHGLSHHYPGVIPVALSESRGADSIVGYTERLAGPGGRPATINDLNSRNLKVCLTPDSPSEFLLHVAVAHFALDEIKGKGAWRLPTQGSPEAYEKLRRGDCQVAVLWEPDVSKALALPGVATVFGSDQVAEMIVDVFVLRRQWLKEQGEAAEAFFQAYFEALAYYGARREEMLSDIARDPEIGSRAAAERAVSRIAWFGLDENCRDWFNVALPGGVTLASREKVIDTIAHVTSVMLNVSDLASDPLGGNPYSITNTEILAKLCPQQAGKLPGIGVVPTSVPFSALSEEEWARLQPIGRLRVVPISFDASTARLTRDGAAVVNQVAVALVQNYPQYRILVKGHTAAVGDEPANLALSEERALAVKSYLAATHGIDNERTRAVGVGSREALPRLPGEGDLAYRNRLARVEFILLENTK
jgi:outer membrane protein OmpA-like peptidoglycan-associated protein/ABC-type nitrate/sulfonate/bicarbonate transport system substrate-binding protein